MVGRIVAASAREDVLRDAETDDADLLDRVGVLAYLHPGRFATVRESLRSRSPPTFPCDMGKRAAATLFTWLDEREAEMTALLRELVMAESPSLEPDALRRPLEILARELEACGLVVHVIPGGHYGDHLYARPRARYKHAGHQLLIGHLDTVWPVSSLDDMPLRTEAGELWGPGTFDMKSGLVEIVFALRALGANGLVPGATPVVFVNADEEVGSADSRRHLVRLARALRARSCSRAGRARGLLKIARKGSGRFTLTVHGRAAHAGSNPEAG